LRARFGNLQDPDRRTHGISASGPGAKSAFSGGTSFMDRAADIIPISSRSSRRAPMLVEEPIQSPARPGKSSWWALVLVVTGLLLVAVAVVSRAQLVKSVRDLPAADRAALYHRTLTDVETACTVPEARDGALHDHCLRQAEFLTLFSDCDARCQQLAASVLPHARR
jgi:hypothetical protein